MSSFRKPARAVIRIDLGPHVAPNGELGTAAETAAWAILATVLPGQCVEVALGTGRWLSQRLLRILRDGLADAGAVQISGTDGAVLVKVVALLERVDW